MLNAIFEIYTDGAYFEKRHVGAWAFVVTKNGELVSYGSKSGWLNSSLRAELKAVNLGLSNVPRGSQITVFTDCSTLILFMEMKSDLPRKRSWLAKANRRREFLEDINMFHELTESRRVKLEIVKSSSTPNNHWCHKRCRQIVGAHDRPFFPSIPKLSGSDVQEALRLIEQRKERLRKRKYALETLFRGGGHATSQTRPPGRWHQKTFLGSANVPAKS